MPVDFTLKAYSRLVEALVQLNIHVYSVFLWQSTSPKTGVVIRHDVDRKPRHALKMAELEHSLGIKTTYYFRADSAGKFPEDVVKKICALGHEIGYHYEDLARCKGDGQRAKFEFSRNLDTLRKLGSVKTVAMHGSPLSSIDNHDIWKYQKLSEYNLTGDAILSVDYQGVFYFTDTGRTWGETSANLRDFPSNMQAGDVNSTAELVKFYKNNVNQRSAVVCHPERWGSDPFDWASQYLKDSLVNSVKRVLRIYRQSRQVSTITISETDKSLR